MRLNALNDVATIYLDRKLFDNRGAVTLVRTHIDFVKISRNADANTPTYDALETGNTVEINGSSLVVDF